jgi:hypothetical protein
MEKSAAMRRFAKLEIRAGHASKWDVYAECTRVKIGDVICKKLDWGFQTRVAR